MSQKLVSILEVYDYETAQRTVLEKFDHRIEAPEWTPDGKSLIYNAKGHIYQFSLADKKSIQINTANCDSCNNDHVVSPDGKALAISGGCGEAVVSRIWILPIGGGWPKMITEKYPSYLHSWSPDGKKLAYCAEREGAYNIYTIEIAETTLENKLTDTPALDDGPEFSPEGDKIWFHSVRSGLAQIWKMNSDGSKQEQVTFDNEWNSWFPHISPDGKKIVYLAFHADDVEPDKHPADKNVAIRELDPASGSTTTLIELFGGQGTINVNSWAPDNKQFAFVSYQYQ